MIKAVLFKVLLSFCSDVIDILSTMNNFYTSEPWLVVVWFNYVYLCNQCLSLSCIWFLHMARCTR